MKLPRTLSLMLVLFVQLTEAYKILCLLPLASQSHKNLFDPLINELAGRGHEVTVVAPYKLAQPIANINEIQIENIITSESTQLISNWVKYSNYHPLFTASYYKPFTIIGCKAYFENAQVKQLLKSGKQFDVVIVNALLNDCALATAPLLGKYIIMHSPTCLIPWNPVFVPQPPSYVPNIFLPYTSRMNFFQRVNNVVTNIGFNFMYNYHLLPAVQDEITKHVAENPLVHQAHQAVSLTLTNSDPVLISARPSMPNIVNVGGLHCTSANPLPSELEDFVKKSGNDGFIYFSLGSNILIKDLENEIKDHLLNAFSKLKQKVIFKCEEELNNLPPNVKLVKWAPQQDLLGHPKIKAFITHGGLLSLQESVYHEVPVVAIPLMGDQPSNVARVVELEIGLKLDFHSISTDSLLEAVDKILSNSYKDNVKKYSRVFRDHYQHPVQRAAFWVEYVVRHDGAKHLRSPGEDLNLFQYLLLDILALLLLCFVSVLWVMLSVGKCVLARILPCGKKTKKLTVKKKQ
uniref:UDP-glucuronosyltransferase n=1 Tax=Strigamia maritima TaxID=126957 RepID=T1JKF7_STRMM|nr:UDP-glycosyltransferase 211A2 [Strigamia maritima]